MLLTGIRPGNLVIHLARLGHSHVDRSQSLISGIIQSPHWQTGSWVQALEISVFSTQSADSKVRNALAFFAFQLGHLPYTVRYQNS